MALIDDLDRIAAAAERHARAGERLTAVLAAEPLDAGRVYVCAFVADGERTSWLALDDAGERIDDLRLVREAVQLAALCEVAADAAGGAQLDELRARLAELREHEEPAGVDEAEAAAQALADAVAAEPRVATTEFLDRVGALARALEQALGTASASPFATTMQQALGAVEELTADVERAYKGPLA